MELKKTLGGPENDDGNQDSINPNFNQSNMLSKIMEASSTGTVEIGSLTTKKLDSKASSPKRITTKPVKKPL